MHTSSVNVRTPLAVIPALVALLAAVAAGCGGSAMAVPELSSFTNAAQTSAAADSARFSLEAKVAMSGIDKKLSFSADGGFDTPAKRSEMSVDLSSVAELMKGFASGFGGNLTGDFGNPEDWKLEVIQDGDTAYVHFPLLAKQLPGGKTWLKGDAKTLSSADAGQLRQFGSLAGTDPRDVFGLLKAVSGSIAAVGTDELHGVETSHYKATIDIAKLEQLVPAAQRDSLGSFEQGARQAGLAEIPLEIWIDSEQRVRKLSIDVDAKQPGTSAALKASLVVELYDYGKALELELPSADQVADAATLKRPS